MKASQGSMSAGGNTNHEKANASHATKRIPGPVKSAKAGNPTKGGGITRATAGQA